jgi:phosphohistidine phosphatase
MKVLYLVRHAKSDWGKPGQKDEERILLEKGIKRTAMIVDYLRQKEVMPDVIVSSPAARASLTANLIAAGLGYPEKKVDHEQLIYSGDSDDILDHIYETPAKVNSMMIVGHNPTLTNLANRFLDEMLEWLPTSAVVCIHFDTEKWADIRKCPRQTGFVISPKMLK